MSENCDLDTGGDLGLGRGLKPGAISVDEETDEQFTTLVKTPPPFTPKTDTKLLKRSNSLQNQNTSLASNTKPRFKLKSLGRSKTEIDSKFQEEDTGAFPIFAEIPLGTSIGQQKKLFEHQLHQLIKEHQEERALPAMNDATDNKTRSKADNECLQRKLQQTEMEVDMLRQNLELCQVQLEAKYKAIGILQKQTFAAQSQQLDATKSAKQINKKLQQELNTLQFELEYRQGSLMYSQQTWAERFDRACQENAALMATMEAKSEDMKRINNENIALRRERDELLALLDIGERQRYETSGSSTLDDVYSTFTSADLAVLGACHCRIHKPEPCGCAHTAANLRKQLVSAKEQCASQKKQCEEAMVTVDAFRIAFEEQLARNRKLMQQLARMSSSTQQYKSSKVKATLQWLIQQLNEDETVMSVKQKTKLTSSKSQSVECNENHDTLPSNGTIPQEADSMNGEDHNHKAALQLNDLDCDRQLTAKSEDELLTLLIEMVTDRNQALAHQRLAARMLATRTQELEQKLSAITENT